MAELKDNEVMLDGKVFALPFTPHIMMQIGSHPKGLQGLAQSVNALHVPDIVFIMHTALSQEEQFKDKDMNEVIFASGGVNDLVLTLRIYLHRLAHGGKTVDDIADALNNSSSTKKKKASPSKS